MGEQGHEGNGLVCRKTRYSFTFLSQIAKVNLLKTIVYSKELHLARWQIPISTLLVVSWLQEKQGLTGHPTPESGSCSLPGSFICAKQHRVVTEGWVIPGTFLLREINFKDPMESWKLIKMINNDRNWMRSTIILLLSTMWWVSTRNAKET